MSRSTMVVIHGSNRVHVLRLRVLEVAHGPEPVFIDAQHPRAELDPRPAA